VHIYRGQPFPFEATRRRWCEFRGRLVIAEEDGRAVGFVAFHGEVLHALYVVPELWSRGIGSRLLELAGPVSSLWVLEENRRARLFYERHGWVPDDATHDAFGANEMRYRKS
jgi:GNAT superfamily N-acetyltransferase